MISRPLDYSTDALDDLTADGQLLNADRRHVRLGHCRDRGTVVEIDPGSRYRERDHPAHRADVQVASAHCDRQPARHGELPVHKGPSDGTTPRRADSPCVPRVTRAGLANWPSTWHPAHTLVVHGCSRWRVSPSTSGRGGDWAWWPGPRFLLHRVSTVDRVLHAFSQIRPHLWPPPKPPGQAEPACHWATSLLPGRAALTGALAYTNTARRRATDLIARCPASPQCSRWPRCAWASGADPGPVRVDDRQHSQWSDPRLDRDGHRLADDGSPVTAYGVIARQWLEKRLAQETDHPRSHRPHVLAWADPPVRSTHDTGPRRRRGPGRRSH